jgi:hypothetical protein
MTKSPLDLAADGLYEELKALEQDLSKLPDVTRPIALLYMFQGMVDNGGFRYPMGFDFPGNPPYAEFVDAYRQIGAMGAAAALEQAVALFPFPHPECDADARNEFFASLGNMDEFEDSEFNKLSDRVCGDETIWKRMDEYVEKHHEDFAPFIKQ